MADPEQEIVEQSVRDTEDELMKSAFEPKVQEKTDEKPEAKAPEEKVEATPEKPERERDPATGKFVRREGEVEQKPPAEAPAVKDDEVLPSWRAREINEERRQAQAELERMRVEHARLSAWASQVQRQQQPQKAPEAPDPLLDLPGYTKFVLDQGRAEWQQQQALDRLNFNLDMTQLRHGKQFEAAFEAVMIEKQRGNQALVNHLISQANPGEAIVRWHTNNEVLREVGPDPAAYKQKTQEQLLNDPEFRAKAEAHWREQAMGGQPQKPNTVVRMPPSLSKATGSADAPSTATDGSEASIFNYAMQPKRR